RLPALVGAEDRIVPSASRSVAVEARVHEGVENRPEGVADARRDIHPVRRAQRALPGEDLAGRESTGGEVKLVVDLAGAGPELQAEPTRDAHADLAVDLGAEDVE